LILKVETVFYSQYNSTIQVFKTLEKSYIHFSPGHARAQVKELKIELRKENCIEKINI